MTVRIVDEHGTRSRRSSSDSAVSAHGRIDFPGTASPTPAPWSRTASTTRRSSSRTHRTITARRTRSCSTRRRRRCSPQPLCSPYLARRRRPGRHRSASTTRSSEPAHAILYVDGRQIVLGHATRSRRRRSPGTDGSTAAAAAGRYVLSIAAQDLAGNRRPPRSHRHGGRSATSTLAPHADHRRAAAAGSRCASRPTLRRYKLAARGRGTASGARTCCACGRRRSRAPTASYVRRARTQRDAVVVVVHK